MTEQDTLVNEQVESQTDESVELETAQEEPKADEVAEQDEKEAKEVNPKTLENAISRRDKKINKMRAENHQIMQEMTSLKEMIKTLNTGKTSQEPKIDDYESVTDFVKAVIEYQTKQNAPKQEPLSQEDAYKSQQMQAKDAELRAANVRYSKEIPDFREVMDDNVDVFNDMPDDIAELFFQVEDGAIAAYNLAKAGKLERLASMNPAVAALEIYKAQEGFPAQKKVVPAPKPISTLKGTGAGQKSTDEMSGKELLKQYRLS
jgi:chromosome segregation ATPase